MFGKILYYDKKTIDEYRAIATGTKNIEIEEYNISDDKGFKIDLKAIGADSKAGKNYKAKVQESILLDCNNFEKIISDRDDYIDFSLGSYYDIKTVRRGTIIKTDAYISIPEEFDMVKLFDEFKPILMNSVDMDDNNDDSKEALEVFLGKASSTKIPLIVEVGEEVLCGKLVSDNLLVDYSEISDSDDLEMTILARCSSSGMNSSSKPHYNPLIDFLKFNRMMRKQMKDMPDEFGPLFLDTDYKSIDILAIYI